MFQFNSLLKLMFHNFKSRKNIRKVILSLNLLKEFLHHKSFKLTFMTNFPFSLSGNFLSLVFPPLSFHQLQPCCYHPPSTLNTTYTTSDITTTLMVNAWQSPQHHPQYMQERSACKCFLQQGSSWRPVAPTCRAGCSEDSKSSTSSATDLPSTSEKWEFVCFFIFWFFGFHFLVFIRLHFVFSIFIYYFFGVSINLRVFFYVFVSVSFLRCFICTSWKFYICIDSRFCRAKLF